MYIYLAYLLVGLIVGSIFLYLNYEDGADLKVKHIFFPLVTILFWPVAVFIALKVLLEDNFGKIKEFVLIKGKKTEKENKSQEEVANEFEEDEGDC